MLIEILKHTSQYLNDDIKEWIQSINLLLFLQKQNLATAIYLFGLGTLLTGLGLKYIFYIELIKKLFKVLKTITGTY